jgi:hypothetical protein
MLNTHSPAVSNLKIGQSEKRASGKPGESDSSGVGGRNAMTPKQEARLINRAVVNRWNIPEAEMQKTIQRVVYLRDNAEDEAVQMAAVRAIVSMVGQNQKDEHKVIDVRVVTRNDQYDAIAAELGIAPDLIEHAARQADILAGRTEASSTARTGE